MIFFAVVLFIFIFAPNLYGCIKMNKTNARCGGDIAEVLSVFNETKEERKVEISRIKFSGIPSIFTTNIYLSVIYTNC